MTDHLSHLAERYSDVLCQASLGEHLQVVLRRAKPMSAQLQLLVLDRKKVRQMIEPMQFEGVSKDDVNYHLLIYVRPGQVGGLPEDASEEEQARHRARNELLLIYPNGIVCIYDNVVATAAQRRSKLRLREVVQSEFHQIVAPRVIGDRLLFMASVQPPKQLASNFRSKMRQAFNLKGEPQGGPESGTTTDLILVSLDMNSFQKHIQIEFQPPPKKGPEIHHFQWRPETKWQPSQKSQGPIEVVSLQSLVKPHSKPLDVHFSGTSAGDFLCFVAFDSSEIVSVTFKGAFEVFTITEKFRNSPVLQGVLSELEADATQLGQVDCLDFISHRDLNRDSPGGLLLTGDSSGFLYVIDIVGQRAELVVALQSFAGSFDPQALKPVISARWVSSMDPKAVVITSEGNLLLYRLSVSPEDPIAPPSYLLSKIGSLGHFEQLNTNYMVPKGLSRDKIHEAGGDEDPTAKGNLLFPTIFGHSLIQVATSRGSLPGLAPKQISVLWPTRLLRKHDISQEGPRKDKVIVQATLHQVSVEPHCHEGGKATVRGRRVLVGPVVFCSGLGSNGSCALSQLEVQDLVPSQEDDQILCDPSSDKIYYVDDDAMELCAYNLVTGKHQSLTALGPLLHERGDDAALSMREQAHKEESDTQLFTGMEMRENEQFIRFLISWEDPQASCHSERHKFTWVTYDKQHRMALPPEPPKVGVSPFFQLGLPIRSEETKRWEFSNFKSSILCLDRNIESLQASSMMNSPNQKQGTQRLREFQFDPFPDSKETPLEAVVQRIFPTPVRSGKAVLYYNVSDHLLQFSRNHLERYGEDDYSMDSKKKNSFSLEFGEKVLDIKWYSLSGPAEKQPAPPSKKGHSSGAFSMDAEFYSKAKALIMTNHKMYIVDKTLATFSAFSLIQPSGAHLSVKAVSILGNKTILFSTDTHLHYLTQEKPVSGALSSTSDFSRQQLLEGAVPSSGIVLSLVGREGRSLGVAGTLTDRLIFVQRDPDYQTSIGDRKSSIQFIQRNSLLLEPLLLGYLSQFSAGGKSKPDGEFVQKAVRFLDTNQISGALTKKLRQLRLLHSETYLSSNQNAMQFQTQEKIPTVLEISNYQIERTKQRQMFLHHLFPNKDIETWFQEGYQPPLQQVEAAVQERNEVILKVENNPAFRSEKRLLTQQLRAIVSKELGFQDIDRGLLRWAYDLCEILNDWKTLLLLLSQVDRSQGSNYLPKFHALLAREQGRGAHLVKVVDALLNQRKNPNDGYHLFQLNKNAAQPLTIQHARRQAWLCNPEALFEEREEHVDVMDLISSSQQDKRKDEEKRQARIEAVKLLEPIMDEEMGLRMAQGYGDNPVLFVASNQILGQVIAETLGNALEGFETVIEVKGVEVNPNLLQKQIQIDVEEARDEDGGSDFDNESQEDPEHVQPIDHEDYEEKDLVQFYLRCDEGSGATVADVSDHKHLASLAPDQEGLSVWSSLPLDDGEPLELEDKWGKSSQPSYSINLGNITEQTLAVEAPGSIEVKRAFTLEFWCQDILQDFLMLCQHNSFVWVSLKNQAVVVDNQERALIPEGLAAVKKDGWNHVALTQCTEQGLQVLINGKLLLHEQTRLKINFKRKFSILKVNNDGGPLPTFRVTEVRLWSRALAPSLILDNSKAPLALLAEQKRKIRVAISKKKGGFKKAGGLGKPKLGAPSEAVPPSQPVPIVESNIFAMEPLQAPPSEARDEEKVEFQVFNPPAAMEQSQFDVNAAFSFPQGEPEIKAVLPPGLGGGFDFDFGASSQPVSSAPVPSIIAPSSPLQEEEPPKAEETKISEPPKAAESKEDKRAPSPPKQAPLPEQSEPIQDSEEQQALSVMRQLRQALTAVLAHFLGAHPASPSFQDKTSELLGNLQTMASKAYSSAKVKGRPLMTAAELGRIQEVRQSFELVGAAMAAIEEVKSHAQDDPRVKQLKIASLSCLFLKPLSGKGGLLQVAATEPLGLQLLQSLLELALRLNIEASQLATVERILVVIGQAQRDSPNLFDLEFETKVSSLNRGLSGSELLSNQNDEQVFMNIGNLEAEQADLSRQLPKCPQCQSRLIFGHIQLSCFDCFARLSFDPATLGMKAD